MRFRDLEGLSIQVKDPYHQLGMSSRKSPPPAINTQDKGKSRARPAPSRTPSRAHSNHPDQNGSDDEPPTSTLRARNVTGTSMREFPPSPGAGSETPRSGSQTPGGIAPGGWRLPGVKGTMGGIGMFPSSFVCGVFHPLCQFESVWCASLRIDQDCRSATPISNLRGYS